MILYYTIPIDTIHSYVPNVETILQSIQKMYHDMLTRLTPLPGENFRRGWTLSSSLTAKYFRCDFL